MSDTKQSKEGIIRPDWFYTRAAVTQVLPIGEHTLAEWIKEKRIEPTACGRAQGFMGHEIIAAMRQGK